MKNLKSLALVFAAALISFGSFAQASTTKTAKPAAKAEVKKADAPKKVDAKKADAKSTAAKSTAAKK